MECVPGAPCLGRYWRYIKPLLLLTLVFDLEFKYVRPALLEDALFDDQRPLVETSSCLAWFQHDRVAHLADNVGGEADHALLGHNGVTILLPIIALTSWASPITPIGGNMPYKQ